MEKSEKAGLSRNALKCMAAFFMLLDHTAHAFVPGTSTAAVVMHFLGRLTMPIMAYFLAEGYRYTRSKKAYVLRLAVFAVVSAVPFCYLATGSWLPITLLDGERASRYLHVFLPFADKTLVIYQANVIFTLLLGFVNILIWDKARIHTVFKVLLTALICIVSTGSDWGYWCVLMCFVFWKYRDREVIKWALFTLLGLSYVFYFKVFQNPLSVEVTWGYDWKRYGVLLALPLVELLYNGKKGAGGRFWKWFHYAFYPAHLLILDLLLYFTV